MGIESELNGPTEEEVRTAGNMMTPDQRRDSEIRFATFQEGAPQFDSFSKEQRKGEGRGADYEVVDRSEFAHKDYERWRFQASSILRGGYPNLEFEERQSGRLRDSWHTPDKIDVSNNFDRLGTDQQREFEIWVLGLEGFSGDAAERKWEEWMRTPGISIEDSWLRPLEVFVHRATDVYAREARMKVDEIPHDVYSRIRAESEIACLHLISSKLDSLLEANP